MTMKFAKIGFLISSPVLKLESSNRKIIVDLNFTVGSISYLSDLIIDISNNTIEIDQYGTKHSLNVTVAAGIVVWKFYNSLN